jgi:hypothetical protein
MKQAKKEPIRNWKIWVIFLIIFFLGVPWYLPVGSYEPIILGFPYWALIVLVMSLIMSAFLTYVLNKEWQMEDEEEVKEDRELWN